MRRPRYRRSRTPSKARRRPSTRRPRTWRGALAAKRRGIQCAPRSARPFEGGKDSVRRISANAASNCEPGFSFSRERRYAWVNHSQVSSARSRVHADFSHSTASCSIDDNASIHGDFRKVLGTRRGDAAQAALRPVEADLFGEQSRTARAPEFRDPLRVSGTGGGGDGARRARAREPYAMAFVDMRMPPGWDGLKTIERAVERRPGRAGRHLLRAHRLRLVRSRGAAESLGQASGAAQAGRTHRGPAVRDRAHAASGRTSGWCATDGTSSSR